MQVSLFINNKGASTMTQNITVNEQSSIRIEGERILYFDPLHIQGSPNDADIIFITHEHFDHFSPEDIARVARGDTLYVFPESMRAAALKAGIDKDRLACLKPAQHITLLNIDIEAVPAYNELKPFHPRKNGWLGYVITVGGKRIYICGDTDDTKEARAVKCDIVCVPIGGTFTMNAKKAAALVNKLSPEAAVPIHYGTIVGSPSDADEFEKNLDGSVKVIRKIKF